MASNVGPEQLKDQVTEAIDDGWLLSEVGTATNHAECLDPVADAIECAEFSLK